MYLTSCAMRKGRETEKGHKDKVIYSEYRSCDLLVRSLSYWELMF